MANASVDREKDKESRLRYDQQVAAQKLKIEEAVIEQIAAKNKRLAEEIRNYFNGTLKDITKDQEIAFKVYEDRVNNITATFAENLKRSFSPDQLLGDIDEALEDKNKEILALKATIRETGSNEILDKQLESLKSEAANLKKQRDSMYSAAKNQEAVWAKAEKIKEANEKKRQAAEILHVQKVAQIKQDSEMTEEEKQRAYEDADQARKDVYASTVESDKWAADALKKKQQHDFNTALQKTMDSAISKLSSAIEDQMKYVTQYQGYLNARLQGTDKTFTSVNSLLKQNLSLSPFVKTTAVLDNIKKLSDEGVAYNIEQRAFLATVSEKIATTFDAANGALLRIIKLQQADVTASRLGMEASLTKFFNNMFQDTSFLGSMSQAVSEALIDASATMNRDMATEFDYTVQKWLGSLTALGLSTGAVNSIAQGINLLGSGNVQALSSNAPLQTLLALSATKGGLNYSKLLTDGLNASNVNTLMKSMVTYLKEIATTNNQVVKSAYGDIFNLTVSDLRAISNLTSGDISTIYGNQLSYSGMQSELNNQLFQLVSRTSTAEMMQNIMSNLEYTMGTTIAEDPAAYMLWKSMNFLEQFASSTGSGEALSIPFISAAGFGLDLNTSVPTLVKGALAAGAAFSSIAQGLSALSGSATLGLNSWGATEYVKRGGGFSTGLSGLGLSRSSYVGSGSQSDISDSSIAQSKQEAEEQKSLGNPAENEMTLTKLWEAVRDEDSRAIRVTVDNKLVDLIKDIDNAIQWQKKVDKEAPQVPIAISKTSIDALKDAIRSALMGDATTGSSVSNNGSKATLQSVLDKLDKAFLQTAAFSGTEAPYALTTFETTGFASSTSFVPSELPGGAGGRYS